MIRRLAALAVLACVTPALAQQPAAPPPAAAPQAAPKPAAPPKPVQAALPKGLDPQNTVFIDTKYGRIVIKLRPGPRAQAVPNASSSWRAKNSMTTCRSTG